MLRLPVSGLSVTLREPDGADDLAIAEARGSALSRALAILPRLASLDTRDDATADWAGTTVTDFEFALLSLRRHLHGERIACTFDCTHAGCGESVEAEFDVADFLADCRPARPRGVVPDGRRDGWFRLAPGDAAFRLPTARDQAEVAGRPDAVAQLERRCIEPPVHARLRDRIDRAMERLAPSVSRPVEGRCPLCGGTLTAPLHVPSLVTQELQRAAGDVHDDIHHIAQAYHWSEAAILALPRTRRQAYAQRIRRAQREAA